MKRIFYSLFFAALIGTAIAISFDFNPSIAVGVMAFIFYCVSFIKLPSRVLNSLIACPGSCSTPLPTIDADYCNPDVNNAQVSILYLMALNGAAFSDITDPAEWATRLSQSNPSVDAIRTLHVIGEKPAPDMNVVDLGADYSTVVQKTHKLNLVVRETSDNNYDWLRTTECGGNYKFAYKIGKYLFVNSDATGNIDNDFIAGTIRANDRASNNFSDAYEFDVNVEWKSKFHPGRITDPNA